MREECRKVGKSECNGTLKLGLFLGLFFLLISFPQVSIGDVCESKVIVPPDPSFLLTEESGVGGEIKGPIRECEGYKLREVFHLYSDGSVYRVFHPATEDEIVDGCRRRMGEEPCPLVHKTQTIFSNLSEKMGGGLAIKTLLEALLVAEEKGASCNHTRLVISDKIEEITNKDELTKKYNELINQQRDHKSKKKGLVLHTPTRFSPPDGGGAKEINSYLEMLFKELNRKFGDFPMPKRDPSNIRRSGSTSIDLTLTPPNPSEPYKDEEVILHEGYGTYISFQQGGFRYKLFEGGKISILNGQRFYQSDDTERRKSFLTTLQKAAEKDPKIKEFVDKALAEKK